MTTTDSPNYDANPNRENIVHLLLLHLRNFWFNIKLNGNIFLYRIGAYEALEKIAELSSKHPYLALTVSLFIASIILPFLVILGLALAIVLLTFTGFIIVEGALITIASVLLFGCIGAVLLVLIFFGGLTLASYLGFMHVFDLYNGIHKTEFTSFPKNEEVKESDA